MTNRRWNNRELLTGGLFVLTVFLLLFWRYPFDGMTLSDSWFFYSNDGGPFRWYNNATGGGQSGADPYELSAYHPGWSTLFSNRGLLPIVAWGVSVIPIHHRQIGANLFAVIVQLANIGLLGLIVGRLAGSRLAQISIICAALYPFAAGSHFWQFLVLNNLAATCFLGSVLAFVMIDHEDSQASVRTWTLGLLTLVSFWASLILVTYAIFMAPLLGYLALTLANGRRAFRFSRILTPGLVIAIAAMAMSAVAIRLFSGSVPSFLGYSARYQELGAKVGMPWQMVAAAASLGNGTLTFLSAVFSNTAGLVVYPMVLVVRNAPVLRESALPLTAIIIMAAAATMLVWSSSERRTGAPDQVGFLCVAGVLWAALAYLPFMTGFGYPRVVGLMADRVNVLASWGVCLPVAALFSRISFSRRDGRIMRAGSIALFGVIALWLANLHVQKAYYVEAYQKERAVALAALKDRNIRGADGRTPIVLLRRATTVKYPRERLLKALQSNSTLQRATGVVEFVFRRHFIDEYATSSFDLGGLMLFGCCPETAFMTVDGYAHLQNIPRVPVYKDEPPLRLEQTDNEYRLGYEETSVFSAGSPARVDHYSKETHRIVWLDIDESFFTLRGAPTYHVALSRSE